MSIFVCNGINSRTSVQWFLAVSKKAKMLSKPPQARDCLKKRDIKSAAEYRPISSAVRVHRVLSPDKKDESLWARFRYPMLRTKKRIEQLTVAEEEDECTKSSGSTPKKWVSFSRLTERDVNRYSLGHAFWSKATRYTGARLSNKFRRIRWTYYRTRRNKADDRTVRSRKDDVQAT